MEVCTERNAECSSADTAPTAPTQTRRKLKLWTDACPYQANSGHPGAPMGQAPTLGVDGQFRGSMDLRLFLILAIWALLLCFAVSTEVLTLQCVVLARCPDPWHFNLCSIQTVSELVTCIEGGWQTSCREAQTPKETKQPRIGYLLFAEEMAYNPKDRRATYWFWDLGDLIPTHHTFFEAR